MRKYDIKNKRNFIIIGIILFIIIIVFSFFIYKFITKEKKEYQVEIGSVLFDSNKELITTKEKSYIKTKWNDNYYLYNNKKESTLIGKHAIVFDEENNTLKLYGKYFEINKNDINISNDEIIIKNLGISKFYKLSDRKYLIVDNQIESSDKAFSTSKYLLVELDKQGNATLNNNSINLKTISKTKIVTSSYTFDIAREKLIYPDMEVDLSKIIGTSNEYKKGNTDNNTIEDENNVEQIIETDNGKNINIDTNGDVKNLNELAAKNSTEDIKYTVTSVVGINPSLTSISIDYVIYDPSNKYTNSYVMVYDINGRYINKYKLKENSTNVLIDNLDIDKAYSLVFKNDYIDTEQKSETFYNAVIKTKKPTFGISINKVSILNKTLSYKIQLDNDYLTELKEGSIAATVRLVCENGIVIDTISKSFSQNKIPKSISGSINMPTLVSNEVVSLELLSININNKIIEFSDVYYKYKND